MTKKTLANKTATDLSAYTGYSVMFDTDGINVCSAITDQAIGIITVPGATECEVCIEGECPAVAGGAVTRGKYITPHTDGKVINTAGSGCQEFGLALETGVAGDWVQVLVLGSNKTHA